MSGCSEDYSREGLLLCLVGPSGSGKSSLARWLLKEEAANLSRSISTTSRAQREHEVEGKDYYFINRAEFQQRISAGEFFEWEEVHGNLYGTPRKPLEQARKVGHDVVLTIDIKGALNLKGKLPHHTVVVFFAPPSKEIMLERLRGRGHMEAEDLARRLDTARSEYQIVLARAAGVGGVDYFVVNDVWQESCSALRGILFSERLRFERIRSEWLGALCKV